MRQLKGSLKDLVKLLSFTIDEVEAQLERQEAASLKGSRSVIDS